MDRPIVLCGLGRMGKHVLEYLHSAGLSCVYESDGGFIRTDPSV